jgi:quercetin 2,3-dioxygenase
MLSTVDADPDLESSMSVEYLIDPSNGPQWKGVLPGKPAPFVLRKGEGEHAKLFGDLCTGAALRRRDRRPVRDHHRRLPCRRHHPDHSHNEIQETF